MEGEFWDPRPTKRVRIEEPEPADMNDEPVDDMDDLYGSPVMVESPSAEVIVKEEVVKQEATLNPTPSTRTNAGIPGLGASLSPPSALRATSTPANDTLRGPTEHVQLSGSDRPMADANMEKDRPEENDLYPGNEKLDSPVKAEPMAAVHEVVEAPVASSEIVTGQENTPAEGQKPGQDPEFIDAAKAQKDDQEAEWQYDSSDAESSSDSSSDSSSEDESDEDYELLDPATAAKMLMAEEGGDDEDGQQTKSSGNTQLRTKNEQAPEVVPKPDVTVTPEMKITFLGNVENVVDNYALINAQVSGEYQVLEQGSALCLENRTVIGAVGETFGRVQQPMYSVAFTSRQDIDDIGVAPGVKIFYVDSHSTFVFTEPLRNLKGTDASNLHDEELGDEEMEFSDDEAEAAYKRAKKEAKRNKNGAPGPRAPVRNDDNAYAAAPSQHPIMSYDDEADGDDMYTPLSRPSNLQEMMNGAPPPIGERPPRTEFDRGRGRGGRGRGDRGRGDRGRGDRGRGDRGRGDRGRGGRGGRGEYGGRGGHGGRGSGDDFKQRRGPAHSYPDNHNHSLPNAAHPLPQQLPGQGAPPSWPRAPPPPPPLLTHGTPGQFHPHSHSPPQQQQQQQHLYNLAAALQQHQQQQQQQQQQQPGQTNAWPQYQQHQYQQHQYQQNQYPQHHQQQQTQFQYSQTQPGQSNMPAGAFVNPNFFGNQAQQQQSGQANSAPGQNSAQSYDPAYQAALQQLDVLRRLGGAQ